MSDNTPPWGPTPSKTCSRGLAKEDHFKHFWLSPDVGLARVHCPGYSRAKEWQDSNNLWQERNGPPLVKSDDKVLIEANSRLYVALKDKRKELVDAQLVINDLRDQNERLTIQIVNSDERKYFADIQIELCEVRAELEQLKIAIREALSIPLTEESRNE